MHALEWYKPHWRNIQGLIPSEISRDNEGPDLHFPPGHSTQSGKIQGFCQNGFCRNNQSGFNSLHMPLAMGALKDLIFIFHHAPLQSQMKF